MDGPDQEREKELERQRLKAERAKARKAKQAARKLRRLSEKLSEEGELTDWEEEFTEDVSARLDKYGSAFMDPEKGGYDEALSYAQKSIMAQLKKKQRDAGKGGMKRSGFKPKTPPKSPRVRDISEDIPDNVGKKSSSVPSEKQSRPPAKRPFLRIVPSQTGKKGTGR